MATRLSQTVHSAVEAIRQQIRSGNYSSGSVLPAELGLAADLGVSRGTIRRAIDVLVAEGDLTRRPHSRPVIAPRAAPAELGRDVYVWVSRPIADEQALVFLKEISKALSGTRYRMVVREPSRFVGTIVKSDERHFLEDLLSNDDLAGAIIERDPFAENADVMEHLVRNGRHLVCVDAPPPPSVLCDFVGTTNVASARACVEHLLDLGHSRIACLSDSDVPPTTKDRINGYWRAMRHAGVEGLGRSIVATDLKPRPHAEVVLAGPYARVIKKSNYFSDIAFRAVHEILAMDPRPTALFVCHDVMAFWICACLEGMGFQIPGDFSVVGFDWLAKWDKGTPDVLTTAGQDFDGFGRHAANLVLDRLTGELPPVPRHVLLDAPLVVRTSTASDLRLPSDSAPIPRAELPT
jgi:DNA-binding LacI/PurR family transcriptional regulator